MLVHEPAASRCRVLAQAVRQEQWLGVLDLQFTVASVAIRGVASCAPGLNLSPDPFRPANLTRFDDVKPKQCQT